MVLFQNGVDEPVKDKYMNKGMFSEWSGLSNGTYDLVAQSYSTRYKIVAKDLGWNKPSFYIICRFIRSRVWRVNK